MKEKVELKGITWSHSRGYTPLIACSQRFAELHPEINITWRKRSLQEFADFPIEQLVHEYDLLVIDHPWVGTAAATQCVLPLDQYLSASYLNDQLQHSVGYSHLSYFYNGHQWALAIDAATPVASYRKDLLEKNNVEIPGSWRELIHLADKGKVAVPAIPIDLLMNFYMFCIAAGKEPFTEPNVVIDDATGKAALQMMVELWSRVDPRMFTCNPIAVAELMTTSNEFWYCPFAYGYSNYSRRGYAQQLLHYTDLVRMDDGKKLRSTLGGTGLSVSASCKHKNEAILFTGWIGSREVQSTIYTANGGQPGHRLAWEDEDNNRMTNGYFMNTLPALDSAFVRPRYNGYLYFQDHAGIPLWQYLQDGGSPRSVLDKMNELYRQSLKLNFDHP
ncbi:MAG: extracellular solute-binding protein [Chitinophagaceae bacterium]|nr:extracellular solute-binding protein [Chitinophagaceae bacterium]